jgi:hypothetical protein
MVTQKSVALVTKKALEPIGESMADDEAVQLVARKDGSRGSIYPGQTTEQGKICFFNSSMRKI